MRIMCYHRSCYSNTGHCFGFKEMLLDAGFPIDTIIKSHLSNIAVILGIQVYVYKSFLIQLKTADKNISFSEERCLFSIISEFDDYLYFNFYLYFCDFGSFF